MKLVIASVATVSGVLFALSMASGESILLPKHEGYPMKNSGSPVTASQPPMTQAKPMRRGESRTQGPPRLDDKHVQQNLMKSDNERITTGQGANQLPTVQGPQIKIAPPVTSATKISGVSED